MKRYFAIFKNWRIDVIALVFSVGVALFVCDGTSIETLIILKILGLLLIYLCACLAQYWKGQIRELDVFHVDDEQ